MVKKEREEITLVNVGNIYTGQSDVCNKDKFNISELRQA